MPTLADGTPVFTAVAGATALATDQNNLQAELIKHLGDQYMYSQAAFNHGSNAAWNTWAFKGPGTDAVVNDLGCWWWETSDTTGDLLIFPLNMRKTMVINEVTVEVAGTNTSTGGSIDLYYGVNTDAGGAGGLSSFDVDNGTANVFNTTDQGSDNAVSYTRSTGGITIGVSSQAFIAITSPSGGGTPVRVYNVGIKFQMGT